jgi:hypothetical protein
MVTMIFFSFGKGGQGTILGLKENPAHDWYKFNQQLAGQTTPGQSQRCTRFAFVTNNWLGILLPIRIEVAERQRDRSFGVDIPEFQRLTCWTSKSRGF